MEYVHMLKIGAFQNINYMFSRTSYPSEYLSIIDRFEQKWGIFGLECTLIKKITSEMNSSY